MPLPEAVARLPERIPLPEANFFAIVVAIQARSGGSLSEALSNLSKVLRDRKKMAGKIRAMSAEAKSSAGIIGSLPIIVAVLVYFTSPDYIALLFTTTTGNIVLGCRRLVDVHRHHGDAQDDQLRLLRRAPVDHARRTTHR